jgi:hypothetical protein
VTPVHVLTAGSPEILADHSVLLAIPAFAPAFAVVGVVIYIAMRDRREDGSDTEGDGAERTDKDGTA